MQNPPPHVPDPDKGVQVKDVELRCVKMLDRSVRDDLGGLRTVWAEHGQARHFLLPNGANCPYSYRRCLCRKCEWVVGRQPLYASDVVRFYQSRHPEAVNVPIPPPPTCERYDQWPLKESPGCPCPRCEEGRGSHDDDDKNVSDMGHFSRSTLSRYLQTGRAGTVSVVYRPIGASQGVRHLRFEPPYNRTLYEMLDLPKPIEQWKGFGRPASKRRLDYSEGEGSSSAKRRVVAQPVLDED